MELVYLFPVSFELMRKEQQKSFQEKQKLNVDKNKDEFDINSLLDDNDKRLISSKSNESVEPPVSLSNSSNAPSATRPLVPPGFKSTGVEKNLASKTSANTHATEVGSFLLKACFDPFSFKYYVNQF